jgi:L,D-transpeptidase YbiS
LAGVAARGTGYRYEPIPPEGYASIAAPAHDAEAGDSQGALRQERRRRRELQAQYERLRPRGIHIVIDQTHNRLLLKDGDAILREAICSGGSGMLLRDFEGVRSWVFDTPRGVFEVRGKIVNPMWRKPDWAFVEEGLPVPKNPEERFERGTLGEYALSFGNGYFIHGTLYTRLLGRSVTHGCIRLGADDLREVYRTASIGTPIFIF